MRIDILSIFPEVVTSYMSSSIMSRARDKGALEFYAFDLRDWTSDFHRTVDDAPYGGGQGMVMMPQPLFAALEEIIALDERKPHIIFLTPSGEVFNQEMALNLSTYERLLFVCGRYEGIDERVIEHFADQQISIGDYVLTGGELAALVVSDAVVRLLPDVLGNELSNVEESFSEGLLEHPHYTRPAEFRGLEVPSVLLSGNHAEIKKWRETESYNRTMARRPDLLNRLERDS